jgi:4-amino-4-deoxy-L-arabinose transferase-like glycosyltransferase
MNGEEKPENVPSAQQEVLDPIAAAALLEETRRRAERRFDPRPPVLMTLLAALVLVAYGALWLSTRGQHPYRGPSGGAIAFTYVVVALSAAAAVKVYRRAFSGVSGASIRQQRIEGVALGVSVLGSPMIQGAMHHYHASDAIVYGVIPAAAPLIIIGTTLLGIAGSKADWLQFWAALTVVTAGMVALFVGPSNSWLAAGIGIFLAIVGFAVARAKVRARKEIAWAPTPSTR